MSIPDRLAYVRRLDYLYVSAVDAQRVWEADSSELNWRRFNFCRDRYERASADAERLFGKRRQSRGDKAA